MKSNITIISGVKKVSADVAKALAETLDMLVLDTDDFIAYEMEMELNKLIGDYGSEFFYKIETKKIGFMHEYENAAIATSPTLLLNPENIEILKKFSYIVVLDCDPELEWKRFHKDMTLVMRPHLAPLYSRVIEGKQALLGSGMVDIAINITSLKPKEIVAVLIEEIAKIFG